MLDVLLYRYTQLPQPMFFVIGLLTVVCGGILGALILPRRDFNLTRSHYFLQIAVATFVLGCVQLAWLAYLPALRMGASGLLLLSDLGTNLAYGVYILHIARARSRDGWGDDAAAILAYVPLLNLILLFKPSRAPQSGASNALVGVALLVLFLTRALGNAIGDEVAHRSAAIAEDSAAQSAFHAITLRADGIEKGLDDLIAVEGAPLKIGPTLTLSAVRRQGLQVIYEFSLDEPDATSLDVEYRKSVISSFCDGLMPYMVLGATGQLHYVRSDGAEVETLDLSVTACTT
jgi:hypothetical protein